MAHFVGIRYTLAFAGVHQQTSGGWLWCRRLGTSVSQDQVCFLSVIDCLSCEWELNRCAYEHQCSCIHAHGLHAYMMFKNVLQQPHLMPQVWPIQIHRWWGVPQPRMRTDLSCVWKIALCKVLCSCVFFFKWHFSSLLFMFFIVLYFFMCETCFFILLIFFVLSVFL